VVLLAGLYGFAGVHAHAGRRYHLTMIRTAPLALLALCTLSTVTRADVSLPSIFGDHMILQRDAKVPLWGKAAAGERVTVKIAGQEKAITADDNGKWRVTLDPINAPDPVELTVTGDNTITFKDVLFGEVWVCSGQSNMGFALKNATGGEEAVKSTSRPTMRLFTVGRKIAPDAPQEDLSEGKWQVCTPESVAEFSAVAYFFGRDLQDKLNVPIGLIEPSWGGTRAEAWIPRPTFDSLKLPYEPAWTEQWLNPPKKPGAAKQEPSRPHEAPACLYNGMIAPIAGYGIRGVVWYQGETNTAYGEHYHRVLGALITSWREAWGQGDPSTGSGQPFPFLVVQLPNFKNQRFWPITREAQARVARELTNVGLAVTIDVGESNDIHPREKLTVGKRLALIAQKLAYGMDVPHSGPVFRSMQVAGSKAILHFDHVCGGLIAKGVVLEGFELAGDDGKFVPARATIEGETIVVVADGVAAPKSARYAWANDPRATLYNKADLPAAPFEAKND
jgi:sialate O-acetylesterase